MDIISSKHLKKIHIWKRIFRVGVTNGCFDLLHNGHLYSLKLAKKYCDKLIVLLNSDMSTKKNKGRSRPIENEIIRKKKLLRNKNVDMVIIFNRKTPFKMIKQIKPDYLFKGSDYKNRNIVGSKLVIKNGGKVKILKNIKGISTTNIINKKWL